MIEQLLSNTNKTKHYNTATLNLAAPIQATKRRPWLRTGTEIGKTSRPLHGKVAVYLLSFFDKSYAAPQ